VRTLVSVAVGVNICWMSYACFISDLPLKILMVPITWVINPPSVLFIITYIFWPESWGIPETVLMPLQASVVGKLISVVIIPSFFAGIFWYLIAHYISTELRREAPP